MKTEREQLKTGEVVGRFDPTDRTNTVAGIIKKGVEQLETHDINENGFRLLWLHASGQDSELQRFQFMGSLYGITTIVDLDDNKGNLECYYFDFSDFYRHKEVLDCAIISESNKMQLCLNSFSSRFERLQKSSLASAFKNGILDPTILEAQNEIYIADCDIDRKEEEKIMAYLRKKYGREKLIKISLQKITAQIRVN